MEAIQKYKYVYVLGGILHGKFPCPVIIEREDKADCDQEGEKACERDTLLVHKSKLTILDLPLAWKRDHKPCNGPISLNTAYQIPFDASFLLSE